MKQEVEALIKISLTVDANKDRAEYMRMIQHVAQRAFDDRPMQFDCNSIEVVSLEEEAVIYGNVAAKSNGLYAAAPDLLAALIRLRDCPDVQMENTEAETDAARLQANEAIARAERVQS